MKRFFLFIFIFFVSTVLGLKAQDGIFSNPVIGHSTPDPTVIWSNGYFYLYATEDIRNVPIYRSPDLVDWTFMGTAFSDASRPDFEPYGGIWAPDINYIDGKYVMYYSMSTWGGEQTCGIGVAVSKRSPANSFTDQGKLFRSDEIGVQNSIDPSYVEDGEKKYLVWGSFHGVYYIELSDDGLSLKDPDNPQPVLIAGSAFEAAYIHKRGDYYYLFASIGSCCEGLNSNYSLVVGRSDSIAGPYLNKRGASMLDNSYTLLMSGNNRFKGPGHCSKIVQDFAGNDWIFVHGWDVENEADGRVLLLNRVEWEGGWPCFAKAAPTLTDSKPVFSLNALKQPVDEPALLLTKGNLLILNSQKPVDVKIYAPCGLLLKSFLQREQFQVPLACGSYIVQVNTGIHSFVKKILCPSD